MRLRRKWGSSSSSGGSERVALGVDLPEGVLLLPDLVPRSMRAEELEDADEECWDCELLKRALEDRLGDGGDIGVGCA